MTTADARNAAICFLYDEDDLDDAWTEARSAKDHAERVRTPVARKRAVKATQRAMRIEQQLSAAQ